MNLPEAKIVDLGVTEITYREMGYGPALRCPSPFP